MKIENSYPKISRQQIADFESRQGLSLPQSYKEFLLNVNGGEPVPNEFEVPNWSGESSMVQAFYGIHAGEYDNLAEKIAMFQDRLPEGFLPIASDPGGNLLCLGTKGDDEGRIYFWDHEDELDKNGLSKKDFSNMYRVANDINEFLDKLR